MEDYRVDIAGDYWADTVYKISKTALEHKGRAFSLSYRFVTSRIKYEKGFLGWRKVSESTPDLFAYKQFVMFAEGLSTLLKVSSQYAVFGDDRKTTKFSTAYIDAGYDVTIDAGDNISQALLEARYVHDAAGFEENLLKNHRLLLDKFISYSLPTFGSKKQTSKFAVSKTRAGDYYDNYGSRSSFESAGMRNLENIAQCYGFAKAIATVMEEKWKGKGTLEYTMTEENDTIVTTYEITPYLKSW